ncbi:MAG: hypothetical protein ABI036_01710 [Fibrobacteria bacterium]
MRKNILTLSMGVLAAAFMLTGCIDGPSAPANDADTNQLANAAAFRTTTIQVGFSVPKRTNIPQNDGISTARNRCRAILPQAGRFIFISAARQGRTWNQVWSCSASRECKPSDHCRG